MKPHEFWNCTYREARLYVESCSKQFELEQKSRIILANNLTDKQITASMVVKNPKRIDLIREYYPKLFEKEIEQQDIYNKKASEGEDLVNLMLELSEELKNGGDKL